MQKGKPPLQKAVYLQQVDCIHLLCEWTGENPQVCHATNPSP